MALARPFYRLTRQEVPPTPRPAKTLRASKEYLASARERGLERNGNDAPADDEGCESSAASLETDADAEEDEEDHDAIPTTEEVANRVGATGESGKRPVRTGILPAFSNPCNSQRANEGTGGENGRDQRVTASRQAVSVRRTRVDVAKVLEEVGHFLDTCITRLVSFPLLIQPCCARADKRTRDVTGVCRAISRLIVNSQSAGTSKQSQEPPTHRNRRGNHQRRRSNS